MNELPFADKREGTRHIIDCDADPVNPWAERGFVIEEHRKGGVWEWDPTQVELYLARDQRNGWVITGKQLRKELAKKPVLNANVLDHLLQNPHPIDASHDEWMKGGQGDRLWIHFWGTSYRHPLSGLCVRYLSLARHLDWRGFESGYTWLDIGWGKDSPALVRKDGTVD